MDNVLPLARISPHRWLHTTTVRLGPFPDYEPPELCRSRSGNQVLVISEGSHDVIQ